MREKKVSAFIFICLLVLAGCSVNRPLLQRGWVGGEYETARKPFFKMPPSLADKGKVDVIPGGIKQKSAVLVTRVTENTPVKDAGIQEGDLILSVFGKKVKNVGDFRKIVDSVVPGQKITLSVYRDGKIVESPVTVGAESFKKLKYLYVGFRLGPDISIIPNPDFSIFSIVSYKVNRERPLLSSPVQEYVLSNLPKGETINNPTWDLWLGIFGFGGSESVISQEKAGPYFSAATKQSK